MRQRREYCCFCSAVFATYEEDHDQISKINVDGKVYSFHWSCFATNIKRHVSISKVLGPMPADVSVFIKDLANDFSKNKNFPALRRLSDFCELFFNKNLVNEFLFEKIKEKCDISVPEDVGKFNAPETLNLLIKKGGILAIRGNGCLNSLYEMENISNEYLGKSVVWPLISPVLRKAGISIKKPHPLELENVFKVFKKTAQKIVNDEKQSNVEKKIFILNNLSKKFSGREIVIN
jgi:hypothetical protein